MRLGQVPAQSARGVLVRIGCQQLSIQVHGQVEFAELEVQCGQVLLHDAPLAEGGIGQEQLLEPTYGLAAFTAALQSLSKDEEDLGLQDGVRGAPQQRAQTVDARLCFVLLEQAQAQAKAGSGSQGSCLSRHQHTTVDGGGLRQAAGISLALLSQRVAQSQEGPVVGICRAL